MADGHLLQQKHWHSIWCAGVLWFDQMVGTKSGLWNVVGGSYTQEFIQRTRD